MEKEMKKCSLSKHKEIKAMSYCENCKAYMCNKCETFHSDFFENKNHISYKIDKDSQEISSLFCTEKDHCAPLKYYCKNHNILCCGLCLCKMKDNENGQHTDCDICYIKDIKSEKKSQLTDNIKQWEDLSKNINESISKIKII